MNTIENSEWTFDQPPNCAAFTLKQVMDGSECILRVTHDIDDHGWAFVGSSDASMEDAVLVSLKEIVRVDVTVLEIADLPVGWCATRIHKGATWHRMEQEPCDEGET